MEIFAFLAVVFSAISALFFRPGGVYNPRDEETPEPEPIVPPEPVLPPTPPAKDPLTVFCEAIRDMEGKPGDLNYKNKNPGNVRCSPEGYLPKYGKVKCVNNFAVFETWDLGWEYLKNMVKNKVKKNPTWTFVDFFRHYAPVEDNNQPDKYAAWVAKRCGVPVDTRVATYLGVVK